MARRRNMAPPEKSAVGIAKRTEGLNRLTEMRDTKIATMVTFGVTVHDMMQIMFRLPTQDILRKAKGVVNQGSDHFFCGNKFEVCPGVELKIKGDAINDYGFALPEKGAVDIDWGHPAVDALMQGVRETAAILDDFHVARTTIEWMDKHMGKGTLRYYFPAIAQLIPDLDVDLVERIVQPERLALHLPAIRASAALIAGATMLPDMPDQSGSVMTLAFASGTCFERDGISYSRDLTYIKI